jgi:hypothetical protein
MMCLCSDIQKSEIDIGQSFQVTMYLLIFYLHRYIGYPSLNTIITISSLLTPTPHFISVLRNLGITWLIEGLAEPEIIEYGLHLEQQLAEIWSANPTLSGLANSNLRQT